MDPELEEGAPPDTPDSEPSLEDKLAAAIGEAGDEAEQLRVEQEEDEPEQAEADPAASEAEPAADGQPAPAQPAKPEAKDPDAELYAPLPEHNPRKTHERFAKLVETTKARTSERDAALQEREQYRQQAEQFKGSIDYLRELGFDSQEAAADLQQFSQYRKALATGNADAAISILQAQAKQLALATGRRIDFNPLQGFDDLEQRHQAGELDERTAMELARSRSIDQARHQQAMRQQQELQAQQQAAHVELQAVNQVKQLVSQLEASDPDFNAIQQRVMQHLPYIKQNFLPHQWTQEVKRTYDTEARFMRLEQQKQTPPPQPMRGNGHAGGKPAPTSMEDAVRQAMGF